MALNKIVDDVDQAVADIFDSATILIGGFGPGDGQPSYLLKALARQGAKNLTIVGNDVGRGVELRRKMEEIVGIRSRPGFVDAGILTEHNQVKKAIASFAIGLVGGMVSPFEERLNRGEVELEMVPQGTLAERIRAARAGIAAFYVRTGAGTVVEKGKETKVINGKKYVLEYAIYADFALVRAHKADRWGNLVYKGTSRTFNATMAGAARVTIAEVDEIVELGELDPEVIVTPAVYVDRIVLGPKEI
jgi:3-oxoadipate CoA-transferase alpha subunit